MVFDLSKVSGISEYSEEKITLGEGDDAEEVTVYKTERNNTNAFSRGHKLGQVDSADTFLRGHKLGRPAPWDAASAKRDTALSVPSENGVRVVSAPVAFLVLRKNTLELRTDEKLRSLLTERYESVMQSRYFGRGGIEIVNSGQLTEEEVSDLVRLSYDLSQKR